MSNDIVDVHTHLYTRLYLDHLAARTELPRIDVVDGVEHFFIFPDEAGREINDEYWSLETKLAYMERAGISQSVVSLGNPWLEPFDADEGLELAREVNREFSRFAEQTDGRVVGMGALPNGRVSDVCTVIAEIGQDPGLFGVVSGTKICGYTFDAPELDDVWSALESNDLVLLVHPHYGLGVGEMGGFGDALQLALGFTFETTVALSRLAMNGTLEARPGLKVIGSHGGGTIPYLAGRLDGCWGPDEEARMRNSIEPSNSLSRLYLDAVVYNPRALRAAADLVGTRHLVFGSDHPFAISDVDANVDALFQTFDEEEAKHVLASNARLILGLPEVVNREALR